MMRDLEGVNLDKYIEKDSQIHFPKDNTENERACGIVADQEKPKSSQIVILQS